MIHRLPVFVIAVAFLVNAVVVCSAQGDALVLVTNADGPVDKLSSLEIRKLYLGLVVLRDGQQIHAITNESDSHLMDIFLQNVMGMSHRTYHHRLLALTLHSGRPRPIVATNHDELRTLLSLDEYVVTCMWQKDATGIDKIRIVRMLWVE